MKERVNIIDITPIYNITSSDFVDELANIIAEGVKEALYVKERAYIKISIFKSREPSGIFEVEKGDTRALNMLKQLFLEATSYFRPYDVRYTIVYASEFANLARRRLGNDECLVILIVPDVIYVYYERDPIFERLFK